MASAVLHVTALGVVEPHLDGEPCRRTSSPPAGAATSGGCATPPTTSRNGSPGGRPTTSWGWRSATAGPWAAGLEREERPVLRPDRAFAQLELRFADGHEQVVATGPDWQARPSAVTADEIYDGQDVDFRRLEPRWARSTGPPTAGAGVSVLEFDTGRLTEFVGPRSAAGGRQARRRDDLAEREDARRLRAEPRGLAAVHRHGPEGTTITLRHAEVLEHGELGVRPLRTAKATDHLVLSGGADTFEPTFTFHGFRYAEVEGWPGELTVDDLEAVVVHSQLRRTGSSSVRTSSSTSCTATSCGVRRATSSTCPPTARSATSASAGPVTSPSSARAPPTCSTSRRSCATGCATSTPNRPTTTASRRTSSRTS